MKHQTVMGCLVSLLLLIAQAHGNIYKCVSEDGVVKYSDVPCSDEATVAFESANRPFDEVIGNASPYPKEPVPTYEMDDQKMEQHARKIGQTIIAGEKIHSTKRIRAIMTPGWNYSLEIGGGKDEKTYGVILEYRINQTPDGAYVWLDTIKVKKHGKPFDPPTMANIQKFRKTATGEWKIHLKRKYSKYR